MTSFQDDTLTYPQLIEEFNALQHEIVDKANADLHQAWLDEVARAKKDGKKPPDQPKPITAEDEPLPEDERIEWTLTLRRDPHSKLLDALVDIQRMQVQLYLGLVMARDEGDRIARLRLDAYYMALSRCIREVGTPAGKVELTARDWRELLEGDTPEADLYMEMVSHVILLYIRREHVLPGKSPAPSSNGTTGKAVASESSR